MVTIVNILDWKQLHCSGSIPSVTQIHSHSFLLILWLQGWSVRRMSHDWSAVTEQGKVFLGIRPSKQQITQTNIQLRQDSSGREGEMTEDSVYPLRGLHITESSHKTTPGPGVFKYIRNLSGSESKSITL